MAGKCCTCFMDLRSAKMRDKLARIKKESLVTPIITLRHEALHILDIFTDLYLAKIMYGYSRDEVASPEGKFIHDYNWCFVWICLTTFGPFLIQYSS